MYDFAQLSPIDFEELVRDLLSAEFNQHIESFGPGADQGIDARFSGKHGTTIIQAKHYFKSGRSALVKSLKLEDAKVAKLKPSRYIIVTSVSLNPEWKNKIIDAFTSVKITPGDVIGQEDLNALLRKAIIYLANTIGLWHRISIRSSMPCLFYPARISMTKPRLSSMSKASSGQMVKPVPIAAGWTV